MIPTEIIDRYEFILLENTRPSEYSVKCEPDPGTSSSHLGWMLRELRTMEDIGKANRWLGFIQGVMVMKGYIRVNEERNFTRPFFQKGKMN